MVFEFDKKIYDAKIIVIDRANEEKTHTDIVQRAVDECAESGGGTVRFSRGDFILGTVHLRSDVTVEIPRGTRLLGCLNYGDFDPEEKIDYVRYQDSSHTFFHPSMFVGENVENVRITGGGEIDMRSVWDEDDVRKMAHRGAKTIALKNCKNVEISDLKILRTTDLAVYFAGCEKVEIHGLKLYVHIDGISPDNCRDVEIYDCDVEAGDDGVVFKSSYTLNRVAVSKNIHVWNCRIKSRCNAVKFGTETIGGFENILIENIDIYDTRISGLAIESVDGAVIDGITVRNIYMHNVNAPLFVHLGKRMYAPKERPVGSISNISIENLTATGPYEPYQIITFNYPNYKSGATLQNPWIYNPVENETAAPVPGWQFSCNVCGLDESPLRNISLKNVRLVLDGGVVDYEKKVPDKPLSSYPEVNIYGKILPSKGIFFRNIVGLTLENVTVETIRRDAREDFIFEKVIDLKIK